MKIVHFIGPIKPWHHNYNPTTGNVSTPSGSRGYVPHERTFLQLWWDIYVTFVQPEMRVSDNEGNVREVQNRYNVTVAFLFLNSSFFWIAPEKELSTH